MTTHTSITRSFDSAQVANFVATPEAVDLELQRFMWQAPGLTPEDCLTLRPLTLSELRRQFVVLGVEARLFQSHQHRARWISMITWNRPSLTVRSIEPNSVVA